MKYLCIFHQAKALKDRRYGKAAMQQSLQLGGIALDRCDLYLARRCFGSAYEIALLHVTTNTEDQSIPPQQLRLCLIRLSQVLYMLGEVNEIEKSIKVAKAKLEQLQNAEHCGEKKRQEIALELEKLQLELSKLYPNQQIQNFGVM